MCKTFFNTDTDFAVFWHLSLMKIQRFLFTNLQNSDKLGFVWYNLEKVIVKQCGYK